MEKVNQSLQQLAEEHGEEIVLDAASKLLRQEISRKIPAGYTNLVSADQIDYILRQSESAAQDVVAAGGKNEDLYKQRGDLLKQISEKETEIKVDESMAFMEVVDNVVEIDGRKTKLNNGEMRDAYRRYVSREQRKQLAELQGDLKKVESQIEGNKEEYQAAKDAADLIKAKAHVSAGLLNFLS